VVPREARPSAGLAARLRRVAGLDGRYAGVDDAEVVLATGRWDAVASWAMAQELGAARELIRRMPLAGHEPGEDGELPDAWAADLADQLACELAMAQGTAAVLAKLAWDLEARLPLTGQALAEGVLSYSKARMVANETAVLPADLAGQAEALVAPHWAGLTWTMLQREIALAVVRVDPDGARERRENAEKEQGRVRFWRSAVTGTANLSGFDLPADQALQAHQHVQARARAYKKWGLDWPAELLRVQAYLDLLNQTDYRHTHSAPGPAPGQDTQDNGTVNRTGENTPAITARTARTGAARTTPARMMGTVRAGTARTAMAAPGTAGTGTAAGAAGGVVGVGAGAAGRTWAWPRTWTSPCR
jgi:hypothetical protein